MSGLFNGQPVYNEIDGHACAWLRRLCSAGNISRGRVVEADIRELDPSNVGRGRRFHAFAGIGVWDYALRLAGWPSDVPVWTGSCPCQPFSVAGKQKGTDDSRHLWPEWLRLIDECRPPVIFGEQVASPIGRAWLDDVSADLEALGYAVGAADLCAAGIGAPHLRQRLYFMAYRPIYGRGERRALRRWMGESDDGRPSAWSVCNGGVADEGSSRGAASDASWDGPVGAVHGFWAGADWLLCRDGKARPVEPGTFPLAHGNPGRVAVVRPGEQAGAEEAHWYNRAGALKCIGNAIVPQVAAVFIEAALRSIHDQFA